MESREQIEVAESIAREAGDLLMDFYRGGYEVELKDGDEPVTEADRAANRLIVKRLRRAFPDDGIVAEESAADAEEARGERRVWMVDPMDGTKEFTTQTDEFAVMIGLCVDSRPLLGVVNQPATGTLYRGVVGDGAERVREGRVERLQVSDRDEPSSMRLICSRSHMPDVVRRMMEDLEITELLRSGSVGLKIGRIGTADCDLYLHPSDGTKLWDSCAPEAILHAAGGRITDFDGHPLAYDPGQVHNDRGLLASNGRVHEALVERLSGYF